MITGGGELRDFIRENFTRTAFRLETLQQYDPTAPNYRRYLDGESTPKNQAWIDRLRSERARGLYRHRVRIVTHPVTDYTRYECTTSYVPNTEAGEDIRILDLAAQDLPVLGWLTGSDWWLIDDTHLLVMHYDDDGRFIDGDLRPDDIAAAVSTRDALWAAAEPFTPWWDQHIELHRDGRQVA